MAEIIDNNMTPSGKINAGLTLGIIGTALGALNTVGNGFSLFGNNAKTGKTPTEGGCDFLERKMHTNFIDLTTQYYEGKIANITALYDQFYKLDKQDAENTFTLYKYSRDNKDEVNEKIAALQSKVDVMAAVRPYQDALIDARIQSAEQRSDYNLMKRTCKMVEGVLVLGDTSIGGFPSTVYGSGPFNY